MFSKVKSLSPFPGFLILFKVFDRTTLAEIGLSQVLCPNRTTRTQTKLTYINILSKIWTHDPSVLTVEHIYAVINSQAWVILRTNWNSVQVLQHNRSSWRQKRIVQFASDSPLLVCHNWSSVSTRIKGWHWLKLHSINQNFDSKLLHEVYLFVCLLLIPGNNYSLSHRRLIYTLKMLWLYIAWG